MMTEPDCFFEDKEDCPIRSTYTSCQDCVDRKYAETVKQAVEDYEALGESFSDVFQLFNKMISPSEKLVELLIPLDKIHIINRVIVALFNDNTERTAEEALYRRLIYYCFRVMIDEFEKEEYDINRITH
jgi:hypothetical protein